MDAVKNRDPEAWQRHVFRWYSQTFHTPLHQVVDLDLEDVLTAYFEHRYEEMDEGEREREIQDLLETPEERTRKARAKDVERAEAFTFAEQAAKDDARRAAKKKLADIKVQEEQRFKSGPVPETQLPTVKAGTALKDLKELPPDIEMKFVSADSFEEMLQQESGPRSQSSK